MQGDVTQSITRTASIMNVASVSCGGQLYTNQTGCGDLMFEEYIMANDLQSFVEFQRKEESMSNDFFNA